ncbi:MAG TPA: type II toxin-antitoxin system VapC family toxin [Caulobacteraceae bacterium]
MSLVLDASMTTAWLFADERQAAAHDVLQRVASEGATVPTFWRLEVANILSNAVRRLRCDEAYAEVSLARLGRLSITVDAETDGQAWSRTRALSLEEGLTAYDAAYLEMALRLTLPLASCDAELIAAARRRGVEVFAA